MKRGILCFVLSWLVAALALAVCLAIGRVPVAVADQPLPGEGSLTRAALWLRLLRENSGKQTPLEADEFNLLAGARVYRDQCADCHGIHGRAASLGARLAPAAPPLWEARPQGQAGAVGISDSPVSATQWKIANGLRHSGMPAYKKLLTDNEITQVSLLLAHADKALPPDAIMILRATPQRPEPSQPEAPPASKPAPHK